MSLPNLDNTNPVSAAAKLAAALSEAPAPFTVGQSTLIFKPTGMTLEDLSAHLGQPRRLTQAVSLDTPAAFSRYVNLFGDVARTLIFADNAHDAQKFVAVLDYHAAPDQPSWNGHRATCELTPTDVWNRWAERDEQAMAQTEFAQFIEDHIPDIAEPAGAVLVEMARTFEAKKDVTFHSSHRAQDGSVQFTYNEVVTGGGARGASMVIPAEFKLALQPFMGSAVYPVVARLRYRIGEGGKLAIWYDLIDIDRILDRAFEDIYTAIEDATRASVRAVVLGTI